MDSKYSNYHYCIVRDCKNTSVKTPGKLWIKVPTEINMRNTWLRLANKDPDSLSTETKPYFCEDHFDLPTDMDNYVEYKIMGNIKKIRMRNGCVPTRFDCQLDRCIADDVYCEVIIRESEEIQVSHQESCINDEIHKEKKCPVTATNNQKSEFVKKPGSQTRKLPLQSTEQDKQSTERKRPSMELPKTKPDSLASFILNEPTLELCRCCGEIVKDCIDVAVVTRPYLNNNLTVLALNGLRAELDFNNPALPKTLCRACDDKLQDIYKFIEQVKVGQEALIEEFLVEKPSDSEIIIAKVKNEELYDDDESTRSADEFFDETETIENNIKTENDSLELDNDNANFAHDHDYLANTFKRKSGEVENKSTKKIKELKDSLIHELMGDVNKTATNEVHKPGRYYAVRVEKENKPNIYIDEKDGKIVLIRDIKEEVIEYDEETNTYYSSSRKVP